MEALRRYSESELEAEGSAEALRRAKSVLVDLNPWGTP